MEYLYIRENPSLPKGVFDAPQRLVQLEIHIPFLLNYFNIEFDRCIQSISPGWVNTEIVPEYVKKNIMPLFLESEDLAEAVLYVLGTPPRVQVNL